MRESARWNKIYESLDSEDLCFALHRPFLFFFSYAESKHNAYTWHLQLFVMRNTDSFRNTDFTFNNAPILLPRPIRPIFNEEDTINDRTSKISRF